MTTLAVQYLERNPGNSKHIQENVRLKLRTALEMMPITLVLIGWEASESQLGICRQEADAFGAKLFRWHPLLSGDGDFVPKPEWQTIGPGGEKVPGFRGMPEFTFVCPNRTAVQVATLSHLQDVLRMGYYDGIFLDRIRFPSPASDPARWLSCFCAECRQAAAKIGLDLQAVKTAFQSLLQTSDQLQNLLKILMHPVAGDLQSHDLSLIDRFLQFRMASVTDFVSMAAELIHDEGLEVGLDTFSPTLTRMVGQDLNALNDCCQWIKLMTYGHALGPSGLPFELLDLADWMIARCGIGERDALRLLSEVMQYPLPAKLDTLRDRGLEPAALQAETERGRSAGVSRLLAGIELVDLEGVTNLNAHQIHADLQAFHEAGADGLVFSWDLQLMPLERLALVAAEMEKNW